MAKVLQLFRDETPTAIIRGEEVPVGRMDRLATDIKQDALRDRLSAWVHRNCMPVRPLRTRRSKTN